MERTEQGGIASRYASLAIALALVALASGAMVSSCGSGGGDGGSSGRLCSQCGDDPDGPCLAFDGIEENGPDAPAPCNQPGPDDGKSPRPTCTVGLTCLRKLGSAQRRCFPLQPGQETAPQPEFRCDGARPNPSTLTPEPTATLTPTSTAPTPTPTFTPAF